MESFFSLLQKNETTAHRRRRQGGLGRLTPVEFELVMTTGRHPGAAYPNYHLIVQQTLVEFTKFPKDVRTQMV